jgi:hypothetical protein
MAAHRVPQKPDSDIILPGKTAGLNWIRAFLRYRITPEVFQVKMPSQRQAAVLQLWDLTKPLSVIFHQLNQIDITKSQVNLEANHSMVSHGRSLRFGVTSHLTEKRDPSPGKKPTKSALKKSVYDSPVNLDTSELAIGSESYLSS